MCKSNLPDVGLLELKENSGSISKSIRSTVDETRDQKVVFEEIENLQVTPYSNVSSRTPGVYKTVLVDGLIYTFISTVFNGKAYYKKISLAIWSIIIIFNDNDIEYGSSKFFLLSITTRPNFKTSRSVRRLGRSQRGFLPREARHQPRRNRESFVTQSYLQRIYRSQLRYQFILFVQFMAVLFLQIILVAKEVLLLLVPAIIVNLSLLMKRKSNVEITWDPYTNFYDVNDTDSGVELNEEETEHDCTKDLKEDEKGGDYIISSKDTPREHLTCIDKSETASESTERKTPSSNESWDGYDSVVSSGDRPTGSDCLIDTNSSKWEQSGNSAACMGRVLCCSEEHKDSSGDDESSDKDSSDNSSGAHLSRGRKQKQLPLKSKKRRLRDSKCFRSLSSDDDSNPTASVTCNRSSKARHRTRERSFTRNECKEMQRKILKYSESELENFNLTEISFHSRRVTIAYQISDVPVDEKAVAKKFQSFLALERHQIKIIGVENPPSARRTANDSPGSRGFVQGNKNKPTNTGSESSENDSAINNSDDTESDRSITTISTLVKVKLSDGQMGIYILSCGHDKTMGQQFRSEANSGKIIGIVRYSLYLNDNEESESIDLSLIEPKQPCEYGCLLTEPTQPCEHGVTYFIIARDTNSDSEYRIYIEGVLDIDKEPITSSEIQTFQNNPRQGKIINKFHSTVAKGNIPPLFGAMQIATKDGKAIHEGGESGLLITTKPDTNRIYPKMSADGTTVEYYYTFVKAVAMLVAVPDDQDQPKYSLALNLKESFDSFSQKFTQKYPSCENAPVKIQCFLPHDINHFLLTKSDSFEDSMSSGFNEDEGGAVGGANGGAQAQSSREQYTRITGQCSEVDDSDYDTECVNSSMDIDLSMNK